MLIGLNESQYAGFLMLIGVDESKRETFKC